LLVVIRDRRQSDLAPCLDIALAVKAREGYPPRGPIDIERFLAPVDQLAAWVAVDASTVVGHVALHASTDYAKGFALYSTSRRI
jgi:hypothetical protein